jgi:hypothetical protein
MFAGSDEFVLDANDVQPSFGYVCFLCRRPTNHRWTFLPAVLSACTWSLWRVCGWGTFGRYETHYGRLFRSYLTTPQATPPSSHSHKVRLLAGIDMLPAHPRGLGQLQET